jgi:hypothetical protein
MEGSPGWTGEEEGHRQLPFVELLDSPWWDIIGESHDNTIADISFPPACRNSWSGGSNQGRSCASKASVRLVLLQEDQGQRAILQVLQPSHSRSGPLQDLSSNLALPLSLQLSICIIISIAILPLY